MGHKIAVEDLRAGDPSPIDGTPLTRYAIWKLKHPDANREKKKPVEAVSEAPPSPAAPASEPRPVSVAPAPKKEPARRAKREAAPVTAAQQSLADLYADLKKEFGDESFIVPAFIGEESFPQVERVSVDSPNIMDLTGGGLPKSRIIEIFGEESSGKTSLACYLVGQGQAAGLTVAYIDVEQALDLEYAKTFGMDVDHLLFSQPSSGEEALDQVESLVRRNVGIIVVDSVAMLVPQAELDGEMGDQHMALQARMMSKAMRKITSALGSSKSIVVFISQVRTAIGQWAPHGQVPTTTSGGKGLKFAATIRIEVKKRELEIDPKTEEAVSQLVRLKTVKNKVAPPMRIREVRIRFGRGIDTTHDWFDYAVTLGVIVRRGGGHTFPDGHKEPSGEKAWNRFQAMPPAERELIIEATRSALASRKATPTVMDADTVATGELKATRVDDSADAEEAADKDESEE